MERVSKVLGLFLIIIAYTFSGGFLFYKIEQPNEQKEMKASAKFIELIRDKHAQELCISMDGHDNCTDVVRHAISEYDRQVGNSDVSKDYNWQSYWNAVWFATTVYTTIGYGTMAPKTLAGRITLIIYGLVGIPLMLLLLGTIGKDLQLFADRIFNGLVKKCTNSNKKRKFPTFIGLMLVSIYILVCGWIMTVIETDWSYVDAVYFFFVTLTTIGFGDVMPSNPVRMLYVFALFIFGLALLSWLVSSVSGSMEENLDEIHDKIENKVEDATSAAKREPEVDKQ